MNTAAADAIKSGVDDTLVPALEDTSKAVGQAIDSVDKGGQAVIKNATESEAAATKGFEAIKSTSSDLRTGTGDATQGLTSTGSRIDAILNPEAAETDSVADLREMSTKEPSQGWSAYKDLSPKAKSLSRKIDENGVVDIKPGEVNTGHLAELTKSSGTEYGVLQGPSGDLKLIQGEPTRTRIPPDLRSQGYDFVLHTHPEYTKPGVLTDLDKAMGKPNSMTKDLLARADGSATHTEAVVNLQGDVTYFNHDGILDDPPAGTQLPGSPINSRGFVVPVPTGR